MYVIQCVVATSCLRGFNGTELLALKRENVDFVDQ